MKLNTTPRHYMPLSQSQSDDDESAPSKEENGKNTSFKNSFIASNELTKDAGHVEIYEVDAKNLPMSPLRKLSFVLSLCACILFVVIFVFLVPCTKLKNVNGACHLTKRWKSVLQDMCKYFFLFSFMNLLYPAISKNYSTDFYLYSVHIAQISRRTFLSITIKSIKTPRSCSILGMFVNLIIKSVV